ncbi:methyl-accepting chemotaxis protein [Anaerosporobacter sp.]
MKILNKFDIKARLTLAFFAIMLLSLFMAISAIGGLNYSRKKLIEFTTGSYLTDISVKMIRIESGLAAIALRDMYITDNHEDYDELNNNIHEYMTDLDQRINELKENPYSNYDLVEKLEVKLNEWKEIADTTLHAILEGNDETAKKLIVEQCSKLLNEMKDVSVELDEYTLYQQEDVLKSSVNVTKGTVLFVTCILIVVFILGSVISVKMSLSIVNPLKELEIVAKEMSKGNLRAEITYESTNAIGRLADSMRESTSTIREYIDDIDRVMNEIADGNLTVKLDKNYIGDFVNIKTAINKSLSSTSNTLSEIGKIGSLFADMSAVMADDAESLSDGATDQASIIEEFLAQTDTISQSIIDNVEQVNESTKMINSTKCKTEQGITLMNEMLQEMNAIRQSSENISEITGVINDIAEQTNLLSLNASIEAARAGENGKGFAVVASEIRELAQRSAKAVKDIEDLTRASNRQVDIGQKKLGNMSDELKGISESVVKTDEMMNKLLSNAELQSTTIQELNAGTNQIANVVDQNVVSAKNSADNSNELKDQAEKLREMISFFNID